MFHLAFMLVVALLSVIWATIPAPLAAPLHGVCAIALVALDADGPILPFFRGLTQLLNIVSVRHVADADPLAWR